jgi:hypothetical protein
MKELTLYECEICGFQSKAKREVERCGAQGKVERCEAQGKKNKFFVDQEVIYTCYYLGLFRGKYKAEVKRVSFKERTHEPDYTIKILLPPIDLLEGKGSFFGNGDYESGVKENELFSFKA